jgi:hypothetical protein
MLNDPAIVRLLGERFVPMAIDNVDFPNQTEAERDFLIDKGWRACTNGQSVFTADGRLLAMGNFFDARGLEKFLNEALEKSGTSESWATDRKRTAEEERDRAAQLTRKPVILFPPTGVLVANMTWNVTEDYGRPEGNSTSAGDTYAPVFQKAVGVDRIWFTREESAAMARGSWPDCATRRLARMLGYISGAKEEDVKLRIALTEGGRISGTWQAAGGKPGTIKGAIVADGGTLTSLQLLARGAVTQVRDCGFSTNLQTIPAGKYPQAAMLVELADATQPMHRVTPYRAAAHDYLR